MWLHYDCARVTTSAITTLNDRNYICTLCTDSLLYGNQTDHTAEETNQRSSADDNQQEENLEPISVVNDNPLTGNDQQIFNQTTQELDSEPDMYDTTLLKQPYTDQSTNKDDDQTVTAANLSGKAIQQWEYPRRVGSVTDSVPNRSSIEHDDITSHTINPDVGSQNPVPAEKLQKRAKKPTKKV